MKYIDKIMGIIKKQFLEVMSNDADYYGQYNYHKTHIFSVILITSPSNSVI